MIKQWTVALLNIQLAKKEVKVRDRVIVAKYSYIYLSSKKRMGQDIGHLPEDLTTCKGWTKGAHLYLKRNQQQTECSGYESTVL